MLKLTGPELIRILELFGFTLVRLQGSHHILRRHVDSQAQTINIPLHRAGPLPPGMLQRLFMEISRYIPAEDLTPHFYP